MERKAGNALNKESERIWQQLPALAPPSPVFALALQRDILWAGGVGGLASRSLPIQEQGKWRSYSGILPLSSVSVLLALDSLLLVGGSEGIAYSSTGGVAWQLAELEDSVASIIAFAASPRFADDATAVAATLTNGILRTNDGGRSWRNASFGLESMEVTALTWENGSNVLAATGDGIYRSRDAGRAWRRIFTEEDLEIEALVMLSDKILLAASASQGLLRSHDEGRSWVRVPGLTDTQAVSLCLTPAGALLLSTLERGLLRSVDAGETWQTVDFHIVNVYQSQDKQTLFTGTDQSISISLDGGLTWSELPPPPVSDLQTLLSHKDSLLVTSRYSGIVYTNSKKWESLEQTPSQISTSAFAPDGTLLVSGPEGLLRLSSHEQTRQTLLPGEAGHIKHITFRQEGNTWRIWAIAADNKQLLQSADGGTDWQTLSAPFGVLPVVALQAASDRLFAATYDPRLHRAQVWYSTDNGQNWIQSLEAQTSWPIVATCSFPAALSVGNVLFLEQSTGHWKQISVGGRGEAIRRILGIQLEKQLLLFVLTTAGLQRSDDLGETWQYQDSGLAGEQILDIAGSGTTLTVLLNEGRIWQRDIQGEHTSATTTSGQQV